MLWLPTPAYVTAHVAVPPTTGWLKQAAMSRPPSWKVIVPGGVPEPGGLAVTVAVKVTLCPETDGLTDELSAVVVGSWFTAWVRAAEVLVSKLASPLYMAVMLCEPTPK